MANEVMNSPHLSGYKDNYSNGSIKEEPEFPNNVNQDSGYHSLSSTEISNSMYNSSKQVSENKDYIQRNLVPHICDNSIQQCLCNFHNRNCCAGGYNQNNITTLHNGSIPVNNNYERTCTAQSEKCRDLPTYTNLNNEFHNKPHHNNYHQEAFLKFKSTDTTKISENVSLSTTSEDNEELELKIEFCLKFGFSIDQNENELNSESENLRLRGPSAVDETKTKTKVLDDSKDLRPIVIDGSNVAMSHGSKEYFSCKGIQIAVKYFLDRNHRDITVFVPKYRREQTRADAPIRDQHILDKLEKERILVYTPSRNVEGKRITCYDDRFILQLALETKGVIVSNDLFRDLQAEKQEWKELINKRLLMYSFVSDRFMLPEDPLGKNGLSLDNLLRIQPKDDKHKAQKCPYAKKCTYGKKCKFYHPENSHSRSVTEKLKENTRKRFKPSTEAIELAAELVQNNPVPETRDVEPPGSENTSPNHTTELKKSAKATHETQNERLNQVQEGLNQLSVNEKQSYFQPQKNSMSLGKYVNPATIEQSNEGRPLMPPLHSAHSGIVTSSTSPQQRQINANQHIHNLYHSSPPAIPAYVPPPQQQRQKEMLQNVGGISPHHQAYPQNYQTPQAHFAQPYVYPIQQIPAQNMLILQGQVPTSQNYNQYYQQQRLASHSQNGRHPQSMRINQTPSSPPYNVQSRQVFSSPNPHGMSVHISHQQMNARAPHPQQPFKVQGDRRYNLYKNLCALFPQPTVEKVLTLYPEESNPTILAKLCMEF